MVLFAKIIIAARLALAYMPGPEAPAAVHLRRRRLGGAESAILVDAENDIARAIAEAGAAEAAGLVRATGTSSGPMLVAIGATSTYDDCVKICAALSPARKLCAYNEYCPNGVGAPPVFGTLESDTWAPIASDDGVTNDWVELSNLYKHLICQTHSTLWGRPEWGTEAKARTWRSQAYCCLPPTRTRRSTRQVPALDRLVAGVTSSVPVGGGAAAPAFSKIVANALSAGVGYRMCQATTGNAAWRGGTWNPITCAAECYHSNTLGAFQWSDPAQRGDGNCGCCTQAGTNTNPTGQAGVLAHETYFTQTKTGQGTAAGIATRPVAMKLAKMVSCDVNDGACQANVWTSLGQDWWLPFIDGWAHRWGLQVFDGTVESKENAQDGKVSVKLRKAVDVFDAPGSWVRWEPQRVVHINALLRGKPKTWEAGTRSWAKDASHAWVFSNFHPRVAHALDWKKGAVHIHKGWDSDVDKMLGHAFDVYERDVGHVLVAHWVHPRKALTPVLKPLARLFSTLAEMHPFADANSRTRTMVLHKCMVRAGGHPFLLADNGWWIYDVNSIQEIIPFFLEGWCAYEYYLAHGVSPFVALSGNKPKGVDWNKAKDHRRTEEARKISKALYDKSTDKCLSPTTF